MRVEGHGALGRSVVNLKSMALLFTALSEALGGYCRVEPLSAFLLLEAGHPRQLMETRGDLRPCKGGPSRTCSAAGATRAGCTS